MQPKMVSVAADILHTVGPVDGSERKLRSCYTRCLQLTLENKIQSVVSEVHTRIKFAGVKFAVVFSFPGSPPYAQKLCKTESEVGAWDQGCM